MTEHRGWTIRHDPLPLPERTSDYVALPPDFFAGDWRILRDRDEDSLKRRIDWWEALK